MLQHKSLTELRGIAQSFGVPDIFQKDKLQLVQAIEIKQGALTPADIIQIDKPSYDARLMTKPPSKRSNKQEIEELLAEHVARGLRLSFDDNNERWFMSHGKKTDEGTVRMPLRVVLRCANKVLE